MTIFDQLFGKFGGTPTDASQEPAPQNQLADPSDFYFKSPSEYATVEAMENRISEIEREYRDVQDEHNLFLQQKQQNAQAIVRLQAEAEADTFTDASALTRELARRKKFAVDTFGARYDALDAERAHLQAAIAEREKLAIMHTWEVALREYAIEASRLTEPSGRLRAAARAAGITLDEKNSPGLMDGAIVINGAHIPLGKYTPHFIERERREAQVAGDVA